MIDITEVFCSVIMQINSVSLDILVNYANKNKIEFNINEEEAWLIGFDDGKKFIMCHKRIPVIFSSFDITCPGLENYSLIKVSNYNSEELSLDIQKFNIDELGWHTSVLPHDEDGIDLNKFSTADLFYATV